MNILLSLELIIIYGFIFRASQVPAMLSKSVLARLAAPQLRRSLVQCAVKLQAESTEQRGQGRRAAPLVGAAGALLGAAAVIVNQGEDERTSGSFFSRLVPTVNAAERLDPHASSDTKPRPSRRKQFNFIADLVEETAPGLVYIEIKDGGVRDYYTGQPLTVSNGSGFIVDSDGLILTNAHVVINKPRASIQVRLQDGRSFAGVVEDVDVKSDLATVRINSSNLPKMKLGTSKDIRPGEWVIALGSPLALSNTITTGVVSNIARPPDELGLRGKDIAEYIQTDATITFGNSGGPLINLDGEAIGINSMKVSPGISFAIPIDYAKEFLRKSAEAQTRGGGHKTRRYVGFTMVPLNQQSIEELRKRNHLSVNISHGILIYRVVENSPSHLAGLKPGDIVTHINGVPMHGTRDVYKLLEGAGDLGMTVVTHLGRVVTVTLRPEDHS